MAAPAAVAVAAAAAADSAQDHPGRHAMRKLKPCSIRGVDYPSHSAAAAALGLTRQRIHQLAVQPHNGRKLRAGTKPVAIDGVTYRSVADAAAALGVSYWAARYIAKSGTLPLRPQRAALAKPAPKPDRPPLRNAIKIIRRVATTLECSTWIRRLPASNRCAIAEACHLLQQQADLLADQEARGREGEGLAPHPGLSLENA
jgi:hypothetical protein